MEAYKIENLTFTYPNCEAATLCGISLTVFGGEFITVCGKSGCGKTTLLRLLKTSLAPFGEKSGKIFFMGNSLDEISQREEVGEIGFVLQKPDNQIVTDKVWHELAFGMESLGYPASEIRAKVAEMASFFGIQSWFHKKTSELSGGQKQLLNLASVMAMNPSVLILDEPTSQLDPISAQEFLQTLKKINQELGVTVILSEHRLCDAFSVSDRIIVMDKGQIIADCTPDAVGRILKEKNHDMYEAMPAAVRVFCELASGESAPISVRGARDWLCEYAKNHQIEPDKIPKDSNTIETEEAVKVKDVWFRYKKEENDVIKGVNLEVKKGEFYAIVGGNGTGKSTLLSLIAGINKQQRGKIQINDQSDVGFLPQNPELLFVKKTVFSDLYDMLSEEKCVEEEKIERIKKIAVLCEIDKFLDRHPYDLSGGEQERAALAKVLLKNPQILLLDEPTKGMDAHLKKTFAKIIKRLKESGVTIIMVSHDIEFCAEFADRCAFVFDGDVISVDSPRRLFSGKNFYTTSANRISRGIIPSAVLLDDIILACGGNILKKEDNSAGQYTFEAKINTQENQKKISLKRIVSGSIFAVILCLLCIFQIADKEHFNISEIHIASLVLAAASLFCFLPQKEVKTKPDKKKKPTLRSVLATIFLLTAVPLTVLFGLYYFDDKKYYIISLMIILETMLTFGIVFEKQKPKAHELVVISTMCALAVAGRAAFFMLPQFKPVAAVVIIAGVCFGGQTGFLVGAVTSFVSNFLFGQGPWTPWQMFAFGMIGFFAGMLFKTAGFRKTKASLTVFGALATVLLYGGITNPGSILIWEENPTWEMIMSAYVMGFPFDLIHAASTAFFLWFLAEPIISKIERIKTKYGMTE